MEDDAQQPAPDSAPPPYPGPPEPEQQFPVSLASGRRFPVPPTDDESRQGFDYYLERNVVWILPVKVLAGGASEEAITHLYAVRSG